MKQDNIVSINTLRKTITEAKKRYFSNQFGRYEGNSKNMENN